ncbi:MAG: C26 family cysteine hydrolase domain-containing family [Thaumarchaeota archaeon]|nr:C26 family cysteine hydrolase domain-containing family [Nitrososphaerota archaeon]MBT4057904.1 C26 family cysteine hydrolase domain-containing family [Nitrososphaerota archaeon]MBT4176189.1 C26 family cysteine hydrolase domain-containing family [Nitrososphaerota archaeon]MBT4973378.1 C26 family cysteine hydrolase domain-containing family [Nitrososphaerota archaeon]MBT5237878.1 C26 family cysteine hydrolase domain-containing family [Nitrososphaerota archaeon]
MLLLVDNGSVFTKDISITLSKSDVKFEQKSFDEISLDEIKKYNSFILSGRRQNNSQMNAKNSKIILHAVNEKKKLLGICYGAEILALALGGTIRKSSVIRGEQEIISNESALCTGKKIVFESHSYEISKLGNSLESIANSENCNNEIVKHKELLIYGTQFHPEMTKDGQTIITKFTKL